jgi:retron-type reverse transcriptase
MQHKLATWAQSDPTRRFDRLLRLIADQAWLAEAARVVLASSGAHTPGIDGMDKRGCRPAWRTSGQPAYGPAGRDLLPAAGQAHLYPESQWQETPTGYPDPERPHRPARDADGHGADLGERFPSPLLRLQAGAQRASRCSDREDTVAGYWCRTRGRWIIEGDLASYFDTVHHRLLLRCVRRRIRDDRFVDLLWRFLKAGHIDRGLFVASSEGVPQGGVLSPLLSNIMLHEFDAWLEAKYLSDKARKDRWAWNFGIQQGRPITGRENRQWKPAVAYCRYADDFVVIVKGTKAHAEAIRECRTFLEDGLKLTLNMDKSHITHVDDGFVFLGHRIIRRRGSSGRMSVVSTIPKEKAKTFAHRLIEALSGNHDIATVDMIDA